MFKSTPYGVDVTAPVWAADLVLPSDQTPPNTSTSGCEAADYAGMPPGAIILVQRGTCTFAQKFLLADTLGAAGMVFFNEGQPGRTVPLWFNFDGITIPTVAATVETATVLSNGVLQGLTGLDAHLKIDWQPGTYPTTNVIAETPEGDPDNVVVVGAHLDSVGVGPGIQDNGSGSATILEIAEEMSKVKHADRQRRQGQGQLQPEAGAPGAARPGRRPLSVAVRTTRMFTTRRARRTAGRRVVNIRRVSGATLARGHASPESTSSASTIRYA